MTNRVGGYQNGKWSERFSTTKGSLSILRSFVLLALIVFMLSNAQAKTTPNTKPMRPQLPLPKRPDTWPSAWTDRFEKYHGEVATAGSNLTENENNADPRIVGGASVQIQDYPYQAALFVDIEPQYGGYIVFFCGAVVVSPTVVLTAQHCVTPWANYYPVYVSAGYTKLNEAVNHLVKVKDIIFYPKYSDDVSLGKDISILVLESPLQFSAKIQPIPLTKWEDYTVNGLLNPGTPAWISGWGSTNRAGTKNPNRLQAGKVFIVSREFSDESIWEFNPDQIPAGLFPGDGKVDTCYGDSGGPLVVRNSTGHRFLAGLTSWGLDCANPNSPGVYALIPAFYEWIIQSLATYELPTATTLKQTLFSGTLGEYANFETTVFVPKGTKSFRVNIALKGKQQVADEDLPFLLVYPSEPSSLVGCDIGFANCSLALPLEDTYIIYVYHYGQQLKKLQITTEFEFFTKPQPTQQKYKQIVLAPQAEVYFLGIPTYPGSLVTASVKTNGPANYEIGARGGNGEFDFPVKRSQNQVLSFPAFRKGITSFKVVNQGTQSFMFDFLVSYTSVRESPGAASESFLVNTSVSLSVNVLKGRPKPNSAITLEIRLLTGFSSDIQVYTGGLKWKEWTCLGDSFSLHRCSGVVPQYDNNFAFALNFEVPSIAILTVFYTPA